MRYEWLLKGTVVLWLLMALIAGPALAGDGKDCAGPCPDKDKAKAEACAEKHAAMSDKCMEKHAAMRDACEEKDKPCDDMDMSQRPCATDARWEQAGNISGYAFALQTRSSSPVVFIRKTVPMNELGAVTYSTAWSRINRLLEGQDARTVGHPFVQYHGFSDGKADVAIGFWTDQPAVAKGEIQAGLSPSGEFAVVSHYGQYDLLPQAHDALDKWLEEKDLNRVGPVQEVYITDPQYERDPGKWRTDLMVPVSDDTDMSRR